MTFGASETWFMQFDLVHEAGNRTRWRTKIPMTTASAAIIAGDLESIDGVTGLCVNPRTGSVVALFAAYSVAPDDTKTLIARTGGMFD